MSGTHSPPSYDQQLFERAELMCYNRVPKIRTINAPISNNASLARAISGADLFQTTDVSTIVIFVTDKNGIKWADRESIIGGIIRYSDRFNLANVQGDRLSFADYDVCSYPYRLTDGLYVTIESVLEDEIENHNLITDSLLVNIIVCMPPYSTYIMKSGGVTDIEILAHRLFRERPLAVQYAFVLNQVTFGVIDV